MPYEPVPVDTRKGEQFAPAFLAINPNAKVPAIVDGDVKVFDSNAILLYLAEKTGKFLPANTPAARGPMLSWLMFIASGVGPFSGQAVHFRITRPSRFLTRQPIRLRSEPPLGHRRHAASKQRYMLGDDYTLVDMAFWGWARMVPFVLGDDAWTRLPNAKRLFDEIGARPAAQRALALKDRHTFKAELDEEARSFLFPQNVQRRA